MIFLLFKTAHLHIDSEYNKWMHLCWILMLVCKTTQKCRMHNWIRPHFTCKRKNAISTCKKILLTMWSNSTYHRHHQYMTLHQYTTTGMSAFSCGTPWSLVHRWCSCRSQNGLCYLLTLCYTGEAGYLNQTSKLYKKNLKLKLYESYICQLKVREHNFNLLNFLFSDWVVGKTTKYIENV